jgi:hypothetical protein
MTEAGVLTIKNEYRWVPESRLGQFNAYQDGRLIGRIAAKGSLEIQLIPGATHRFQVRLWHWFRSDEIELTLGRNEYRELVADIDWSASLLKRMGRMGLHPHHSLILRLSE